MILGIIGGVGAGKSTVLDLLTAEYGFTAYRTDDIAKSFYIKGHPVYEALKQLLGQTEDEPDLLPKLAHALYGPQGRALRIKVDEIVHPAVWQYVGQVIAVARKEGRSIVVETALPTRSFIAQCDQVWFVYTDEITRIDRLMKTRGYSEEKARAMLHAQPANADYAAFSDWTLNNSGRREETEAAVCTRLRNGSTL